MGFSRLLQKIKFRDGSPRPASPSRTASPADPPLPAAVSEPPSSSLQERLWNQAYDRLAADEPKIVKAYNEFLSTELRNNGGGPLAISNGSQHTERGHQMKELIRIGLRRTEKAAAAKQKIWDGLQTVNIVKGLVGNAIHAAPAAAVAWVCVCFALEVLSNSFTEARANREGLAYVVSRMDWYWNLVGLLLDEGASTEIHGLRGRLEEHILQLYQKLLLYQMSSVCLYHQNQGVIFLKDMVKLDDWRSQLDEIQNIEAAVQRDSEQYNSQRARTYLRDLAATADRQCTELQLIVSAVQDQTSRQEQMYQDEKDTQCLHSLFLTDPQKDKERIQDTKGGLLRGSYAWVLDNPDFKEWQTHPDRGLFWIRGDPGKGKTMLLCGIIDELERQPASQPAYFFCQATDQNLNNATAVLRGLIFSLLRQQPQLISHVRKEYDAVGQKLFEGNNIWEAMSKILTAIVNDPILNGTTLVVDALDECGKDRLKLLKLIVSLSASPHIKWAVSSRNWPDIEEQLDTADRKVTLRLELNEDSISAAVEVYIKHRVGELARLKNYNSGTQATVQKHFIDKANNTFLWVALVYEELAGENVQPWHAFDILQSLPSGLNKLYERMMGYIKKLRDAELCIQILAVASVVYRPISTKELAAIVRPPAYFNDNPAALNVLIGSCGSFLTLRQDVVYFVHQSAKDFLLDQASDEVLPHGIAHQHRFIFSRSVEVLSRTLRRDIYNLVVPGFSIEDVSPHNPDPLAPVAYSCVRWVDHLQDADPAEKLTAEHLQDNGLVHIFLQRRYLYWLEAMALQRSMPQAVLAMQKLHNIVATTAAQQLADLIHDALRFIFSHKGGIEIAPLQLYASALIFSPTGSIVRNVFKHDAPSWVLLPSSIQPDWNACVQTLECFAISSMALAADGTRFASGIFNGEVKIYDAATGQCLQTLESRSGMVMSLAFAADSIRLASGLGRRSGSGSDDGTVQIWDVSTGECIQKLEGHHGVVNSVAFAADGIQLASGSEDHTIKIWDVNTGQCVQTLQGHSNSVNSVAFAADGMLASGSYDCTIKIWEAATGQCVLTLKGHDRKEYQVVGIRSVAFTSDGKRLASGSFDRTIMIWDVATGQCIRTLAGHRNHVGSVAFTTDGIWLVSGSADRTIKIWDVATGQCVQTLQGHSNSVNSVAFFAHSTLGSTWRLISGSSDGTIKTWDATISHNVQQLDGHNGWVKPVTFTADGTRLASGSIADHTIKIWDTATGQCVQTLEGHGGSVNSIVFTADGMRLASGSSDHTVKIWDTVRGICVQTLKGHSKYVTEVAFTANGTQLASGSGNNIKIWDAATGSCVQTLQGHNRDTDCIALTADSKWLASGSRDCTIKIWDVVTGQCVQTLQGHSGIIQSVAFTTDGTRLASGSFDNIVRIWDAATGACMQTLDVRGVVYHLSFDPHTKSNLFSEFGTVAFDPSTSDVNLQEASPTLPTYHGYGISPDGVWIMKDARKLLWLPSEYRPWRTAIAGSCIALGCLSGQVIILHLSAEVLRL